MNKTYSVSFGISAIAALIVAGVSVTPARADWVQTASGPTYAPATAPQANAVVSRVRSTTDVPQDNETGYTATSTRKFTWQSVNGSTPSSSYQLTLKGSVSWPHSITVDTRTDGPNNAETILTVDGGTSAITSGNAFDYTATYNYQVIPNRIDYSPQPDLSIFHLTNTFPTKGLTLNGKTSYLLQASFPVVITNTALVSSSYGGTINYFAATASSGATTITPNSIAFGP